MLTFTQNGIRYTINHVTGAVETVAATNEAVRVAMATCRANGIAA